MCSDSKKHLMASFEMLTGQERGKESREEGEGGKGTREIRKVSNY